VKPLFYQYFFSILCCSKTKIKNNPPTGIPINQQHLLYNHKELSDTTTLKDIPLVNGSRLKLVLGMRGGPVSARRVVSLQDYDNLFDISDVFQSR
jgi:AN1-type zinc finger protein 4